MFSILTILSLSACRSQPLAKSDTGVGQNLEDSAADSSTGNGNTAGDSSHDSASDTDTNQAADTAGQDSSGGDSGDTGSSAPPIVDQCVDKAPATEPTVGVYFTSAWSASEPFAASLGDNVNFGAVEFKSEMGEDLTLYTLSMYVYVDQNADLSYGAYGEGGVKAADYVSDCVLRDATTRSVLDGPVSPDSQGRLLFTDEMTISGTKSLAVNLECATSGTIPSGLTYGLAGDVNWNEQSVFVAESGGTHFINVWTCATNGTQTGWTLLPAVAARFTGE